MIPDFFIGLGTGFVNWIVGLFGTDAPPEWLTTVADFLGNILLSVSGLGVWVPWALVMTVSATLFALWFTGFALKFLRWLLALIPTWGGGS